MKKLRTAYREIYEKILYPPFKQVDIATYPVEYVNPEYHSHPQIQTVIIECGCLAFEQPDHQILECRMGDLLTIPVGVPHRWIVKEPLCRAIQTVHAPLPLHLYGELFVLFGNLQRKIARIALPQQEFRRIAKGIQDEIQHPGQGSSVLIHSRLLELFALAVRQLGQGDPAGRWEESIYRALNYIEEHLKEKITLQDLAAHSYLSVSRFSHIFRECIGQSPVQYINELRIERAKSMLLFSNLSVSETSDRLGFDSIYYFSRLFKKLTGDSPSEYVFKKHDCANNRKIV